MQVALQPSPFAVLGLDEAPAGFSELGGALAQHRNLPGQLHCEQCVVNDDSGVRGQVGEHSLVGGDQIAAHGECAELLALVADRPGVGVIRRRCLGRVD